MAPGEGINRMKNKGIEGGGLDMPLGECGSAMALSDTPSPFTALYFAKIVSSALCHHHETILFAF